MASNQKVVLISPGCAKNPVDSESVLGLLKDRDFPIVSRLEDAEVAIINTCGFIQSAVEESVDTILEVAKRKEKGILERSLNILGHLSSVLKKEPPLPALEAL